MAIIEAESFEDFKRLVKELIIDTMRQDKYIVVTDTSGYVHVIPKKTSRHLHTIIYFAADRVEEVGAWLEKALKRPAKVSSVIYGKD